MQCEDMNEGIKTEEKGKSQNTMESKITIKKDFNNTSNEQHKTSNYQYTFFEIRK